MQKSLQAACINGGIILVFSLITGIIQSFGVGAIFGISVTAGGFTIFVTFLYTDLIQTAHEYTPKKLFASQLLICGTCFIFAIAGFRITYNSFEQLDGLETTRYIFLNGIFISGLGLINLLREYHAFVKKEV